MKTRRTKITIERHEVTISRTPSASSAVFCEHCRSEVHGLTPERTVDLFRITATQFNEMIRAAEIHFIKTPKGNLPLICGGVPEGNK